MIPQIMSKKISKKAYLKALDTGKYTLANNQDYYYYTQKIADKEYTKTLKDCGDKFIFGIIIKQL